MTNVTSDIAHWYGMNEPEDQQGKDDLTQSVETVATVGDYTTEENHGLLFLSGWSDDKLRLASDKAKARFLVPSGMRLEFSLARSPGNMKVSFQAARSIG